MSPKAKLVIGLSLSVIALAGLSLWKFLDIIKQQDFKYRSELVQSESSLIKEMVEQKVLEAQRQQTAWFQAEAGYHVQAAAGTVSAFQSGEVSQSAVQLLSIVQRAQGSNSWQPVWLAERNPDKLWNWDQFVALTQELLNKDLEPNKMRWSRVITKQQQPYLAVIQNIQWQDSQANNTQTGIGITIYPIYYFSYLTDLFKSDSNELMLVDRAGFSVAYSQNQYLGSSLAQHPIVQDLLAQSKSYNLSEYKNLLGKPVMGAYHEIPSAELFIALAMPITPPQGSVINFITHLSLFGVAFIIFVTIFIYLMFNPYLSGVDFVKSALKNLIQGEQPQALSAEHAKLGFSELIDQLYKQMLSNKENAKKMQIETAEREKRQTYKQIGSGMSQSLLHPLTAILGHTQMARAKVQREDLKQHFIIIEREARTAKSVVESLIKYTGEEKADYHKIDLQEVLNKVVLSFSDKLKERGIQLHKRLNAQVFIWAQESQLTTVFENLMKNAIEAVGERASKEITVQLIEQNQRAIVLIKDTGRGIPSAHLGRIFEPFYTTKVKDQHSGLGLTVTLSMVKNMDGQIKVDSIENKGTEIRLEFAAYNTALEDERKKKSQVLAAKDLPKLILKPEDSPGILLGKKPLTGTDITALPAPPSADEVTFVGEVITLDDLDKEVETVTTPSLPQLDNLVLAKAPEVRNYQDGDSKVNIRKPKIVQS